MGFYELAEKALALERQGRKLIRLNVGDTNLPVPEAAAAAAIRRIQAGRSGYGPAAGMEELRQAIAGREGCEPGQVVVGPGSKQIIFGLLSVICRSPGCAIAFPSPYWPAYGLIARHLGLRTREIMTRMEDGWGLDPAPAAARDPAEKAMIMCNPLNPTSTVYAKDSIEEAISQAGRYLILDEAYKGLSFKGIPTYEGDNVIRVRSFSKEFNMEEWRLGYAVAPKGIADKLVAFNQMSATCVPSFTQMAGLACINNEKEILPRNRSAWLARSQAAQKALVKEGFSFAKPDAGIYAFATHDGIDDSDAFASSLIEKGVVVAPGSDFGGHKRFVRICLNQDAAAMRAAIATMGALARKGG